MPSTPTTMIYTGSGADSGGITVTTNATAWLYGAWVLLDLNVTEDVRVYGITFQLNQVGATDTTREYLIEVGTDTGVSDVTTKLQIPYAQRASTAVGIYLEIPSSIFLPELALIRANSNVFVRATCGVTGAQTIDGIKLKYLNTIKNLTPPNVYAENYKRVRTPNGISSGIVGTM